MRIETDSLGAVEVPDTAYWGAQTQRSIGNFPIGDGVAERMPLPLVRALALVKQAAARVNRQHGLDSALADAIEAAAAEVAAGDFDDQFPLVVWQTGSGTQTNMNVNEVIAGRANERLTGSRGGKSPVHPNDHVNRGQSSNDSFPTAMHVAVALELRNRLLPALRGLGARFRAHETAWSGIVKIGRTHLMDATPLTLGQEASAWAQTCEDGAARIVALWPRLSRLAQGGTAVGTGLNAPEGFGAAFVAALTEITGGRAVGKRAQQVRGAGDQRHAGGSGRSADHDRDRLPEDRQRHPAAGFGPARGAGGAGAARERAGQQHHAGEGEPHPGRKR